MAATRLIPMHLQKGKTVRQCLKERTDYAKNGEKTKSGEYVSSYECVPESVDLDFNASKNEYELITGRKAGTNDVIAYQIRQSFKPGEVTPEEANRIGYETAMRWTKGKHAFIVATHTDKAHIHNHIVYNSTTLDAGHKYKNFFFSATALRRLSDMICLEHGLSVIEPKKPSEWQKRTEYPKEKSLRDEIREAIDLCLKKKPSDMEGLLSLLEDMGYEIRIGKYISLKGRNQKRFIRMRSLGEGYREEDLSSVFSKTPETKIDMLLDIQEIISKGKGPGYERWAKIHNIKQMAQTLLLLDEKGIRDMETLCEKSEKASDRFRIVSARQKEIESRLSEISELRQHIFNYAKTKEIYAEYKRHGYSRRFFEDHRAEITLHKSAKEAFSKLSGKVPKVSELNEEIERLLKEKKTGYAEYRIAKKEMQDLATARYNVEHFYNVTNSEIKEKSKSREDTVL